MKAQVIPIVKSSSYYNIIPDMVLYIATPTPITPTQLKSIRYELTKDPQIIAVDEEAAQYSSVLTLNDFYVTAIEFLSTGQSGYTPTLDFLTLLPNMRTIVSRIDINTKLSENFIKTIVAPAYLSLLDLAQEVQSGILEKAKCECGAEKVFGANCHGSAHYRWCPKYQE